MATETNTYPHADLITDNKINVTELPQKTQDLLTKFTALTDPEKKSRTAMDFVPRGSL